MLEEKIEVKPHPTNMRVARNFSILCSRFQEAKMTVEEKQEVLKALFQDFKDKRNECKSALHKDKYAIKIR